MKTTKFFMLAALALSATACSNDNDTTTYGPREAVITAGINTPVTRANGDTWEADNIGVMVTAAPSSEMENIYKNVQYNTTSSSSDAATFTATVPSSSAAGQSYGIFFQDASETVTFAAYGPYQSSANAATLPGTNSDGVISNISTIDQSTRDKQKAFDFIYASGATASNSNYKVYFQGANAFSHKMSRLIIKFVAATDAGFDATEVSNSGSTYAVSGLYHDGTFNVTNGTAVSTGTTTSNWSLNTNSLRTPNETTTATFTSILYPQDHTSSSLTVKATIAGQTYEATIKPNLESGKSYTYTITAKKQGLEVTGCTVTDWTNGGSDSADATIPKNNP